MPVDHARMEGFVILDSPPRFGKASANIGKQLLAR